MTVMSHSVRPQGWNQRKEEEGSLFPDGVSASQGESEVGVGSLEADPCRQELKFRVEKLGWRQLRLAVMFRAMIT